MLIVDNHPGDVSVKWIQTLSFKCNLIHQFVSFLTLGTGLNLLPVKPNPTGTLLSLGPKVSGVFVDTKDKGDTFVVEIVFAGGTGLDKITLALLDSMLAMEGPLSAIFYSSGVAVRVKSEVADFPEVRSVVCSLE